MNCNKCGNVLPQGAMFCNRCGNNLNNSTPKKDYSDLIKKGIILFLLLVIIGILVYALLTDNDSNQKGKNTKKTFMIYMAGSNLEANLGIATADMMSINLDIFDFDNVNVLLYAGGTKKWQNHFNPDENAIYHLTKNGFEKLETYKLSSMGNPDNLKTFLNYSYNNYSADKYYLLFWNHGGAFEGAIYDDYVIDNLTLADFDKALKGSPFNENNKLDLVIFRTCLNATLEVAETFAPYANYLVASEEETIGSASSSALAFLANVRPEDDGLTIGKSFIDAYVEYFNGIDPHGSRVMTYSITDLSKVDELVSALDDFAGSIDVNKNYNTIARVRSNLYQYASKDDTRFDTVDLYSLVDGMSSLNSSKAATVKEKLEAAVVYNQTNEKGSHGLSILFPYNASKKSSLNNLNKYKDLGYTPNYYNLITDFTELKQSGGATSSLSDVSKNTASVNSSSNEFSVQLTPDQVNSFASAQYLIFYKYADNEYLPIYLSSEYTLDENGILKTKLENRMIKAKDTETLEEYFILAIRDKLGNISATAMLQYIDSDAGLLIDNEMYVVNSAIKYDKNEKPYIASHTYSLKSESGVTLIDIDEEDFHYIDFLSSTYDILDENGNFRADFTDHSSGRMYGYEYEIGKYELVNSSLDDSEDMYCVFFISDTQNNIFYTKPVQIN